MKKYIIFLALLSLFSVHVASQTEGKDSLHAGRNCRLILYYGYEAEGVVDRIDNDTVLFRTDIVTLKVPLKDIKFVLNPGYGLPETNEEYDSLSREVTPLVSADTSDECDLYLSDRTVLTDVEMLFLNDSVINAIKEGREKQVKVSDIRKVVFKPLAPFGKGFLIGSGIGFAAGFFSLAFAEPHGEAYGGPGAGLIFGLVLALPSGLIGGVTGVLASSDDIYLFERGFTAAKSNRLKYLIEKHRK